MKNRWIRRRGSRGVAMVEAGILAPIFAMMMMLTIYLGGVYEAKYRSIMKERYLTWSYSSSGCTNSPPNTNNDGPATNPQNPPANPCPNQPVSGQQSASSSLFMAHAYDEEIWDYAPTLRFNGGAVKKVHTDGYTVCNEKKAPAGVGSIFAQLPNELSQVFGSVQNGSSNCN